MKTSTNTSKKINKAVELLKDASSTEVAKVQDDVINGLAQAKTKFVDTAQGLNETIRANAAVVDKKVHKNPWVFVGSAALVGSIVGFFAGKRK
ncbi:hypothetical protein N9O57_00970 [bacterium]|nr:hypothetical protein [bacterium]